MPECWRMAQLTQEIVEAAIEGFEARKQHIDSQIAELRAMLTGGNGTPSEAAARPEEEPSVRRKKRRISAAGRAAIAEAQRKRWAAKKAGTQTAGQSARKAKRKMSAAGRKAISEATKKRWAAKRAAAKNG